MLAASPATILLVGTRKGLFQFDASSTTPHIAALHFEGAPCSAVLADPRDGAWYAALDHGHFGCKLHRSDDRGASWHELAAPAYPADASKEASGGATTQLLWCLEAAHPEQPGTLWCGTIPGGLFRSDDRGESWTLARSLWDRPERQKWFGGGFDAPGVHSICIDPRGPGRMAVGVSCGGAWRTTDDGHTWELSTGMAADFMPPDRQFDDAIQDPHRIVRCVTQPDVLWTQHHNGIYRSTDDCRTWQRINGAPVSSFGFAVAVHPTDAETAWFVPALSDEVRIPVGGQMIVNRTSDGGSTFTTLSDGLPQQHAYHLVYRHSLDVDGSGSRLAMASTTGSMWCSNDAGERFDSITDHLPPVACVRWC